MWWCSQLRFHSPKQSVETQTIPPPRSTYGANVLQWVIYDSYAKDFAESEKEKEKEKDKKGGGMAPMPGKSTMEKSKKNGKAQANEELNKAYLQAWQILERMINQNIYDEIAQGMLVFELLRIPGVILHCALCLQIIATMKTHRTNFAKKKAPCCHCGNSHTKKRRKWMWPICVSTRSTTTCLPCALDRVSLDIIHFTFLYYIFVSFTLNQKICFIIVEFLKQSPEGAVCLFTVKNPSYPDYISQCLFFISQFGYIFFAMSLEGNFPCIIFAFFFSHNRKRCHVLWHPPKISVPAGDWHVRRQCGCV